jgi:hypothetical protein
MEGSMAGTGKPSIVAAAAFIAGLAALAPTAAVAQFPMPMIPNFNFGPQHYRSGSSHYSTHHSSRHEEDTEKTPDKSKEKDATQPDATASMSAPHQQQTSSAPPAHDAAPSGGSDAQASPPPPPPPPANKTNDDQPSFQPSR